MAVEFDGVQIIYEGPPRWDGRKWINGDTFTISGLHQGDKGVELAPSVGGLERPTKTYRYDSLANGSISKFRDALADKRKIDASVNIYGKNKKELRDNKRRWFRNHDEDNPGKLWFKPTDAPARYMLARLGQEAAVGDVEKDPDLRRIYEGFEWGWESDNANFYGEKQVLDFQSSAYGGGHYSLSVKNPSTAPEVFPKLYLYGPGKYTFSLGYMQGNFTTVDIPSGSTVRINFDPLERTYLMMDSNGKVSNMWPYAYGNRPKFSLEAETTTTIKVSCTGSPEKPPQLEFTPEYESWM